MLKPLKHIAFLLIISFSAGLVGCSEHPINSAQTLYELKENMSEAKGLTEQSTDNPDDLNVEIDLIDNPDVTVCQFIAGLRDADFVALQALSFEDLVFGHTLPENINYNTEDTSVNINSDNSLFFQLSAVSGYAKLSNSYTPLVFGILVKDETMSMITSANEVELEEIHRYLDVDRLKGIELVQLFEPNEQYLTSNSLKTDLMSEYRIAVCSIDGDYFAIGFGLTQNNNDKGDFRINAVWNAHDPNKSSDYEPYYKSKNIEDFASLKADGEGISKVDLDRMIKQEASDIPNRGYFYFENIYANSEDETYEKPEDVIVAYIEAATKNDVAAILRTSAAFNFSKGYNLNNYIERFGAYYPRVYSAMPKSDFYDSLLENYWVSTFAASSLQTLTYIVVDEETLLQVLDGDDTDNSKMDLLMSRLNSENLNGLEIVDIFSPMSNITSGDMATETFKKQAKPYGASDKCERIAIIKTGELYSIYPFALYKYENGWKIGEFISHFAAANPSATLYKTKDITEFDKMR